MAALATPGQASAAIEAALHPLSPEPCRLEWAAGRVLREDITAERDQPPFDRVAMDGIALATTALPTGRRAFRIAGTVAAGARPLPLDDDTSCLEVMTGAVLPPGADVVIPVEQIEVTEGVAHLQTDAGLTAWTNVHRRGIDARAGDLALAAGSRLRGPELAIVAAAGRESIAVGREPRVAVISTGDELIHPGQPMEPWQIRRSNVYGVAATLRLHGCASVTDDHVRDDPGALTATLAQHLATHDALVLSGGVSAGRFDHVPAALEALGVRKIFHKVAQRPGKPFWFGVAPNGQAVFALPGNPVSTLVCLVRYVLPGLARLRGETPPPVPQVPLADAFEARHGLTAFIPVDWVSSPARGSVRLHPTHGSGDFTALAGTAGFVELAADRHHAPGDSVPFYTW